MYKEEEDFQGRIREWEALLPHKLELKPKGYTITRKNFAERLLPVYIQAIHKLRIQKDRNWILQEDNDPSQGSRKRGLAGSSKRANQVPIPLQSAQLPDLNPMEACCNILK